VPRNGDDLRRILARLKSDPYPDPAVEQRIDTWLSSVPPGAEFSPGELFIWRSQFNREFLQGVVRAENELGNALKSAEYRYTWYMRVASAVLASLEGMVLASNFQPSSLLQNPLAFGVLWVTATGVLLVLPRGTNSLTEALIGLARRVRG
jgi:hypothetical protein